MRMAVAVACLIAVALSACGPGDSSPESAAGTASGTSPVAAAETDAAATGRKYALLIGIDDYKAVTDLNGAVNDIRLMRELLVGQYGFKADDVVTLENSAATHAGIVAAIREKLVARAQPGDVVVLHFSGHGSQMQDAPGGDEVDGWDETLVAWDSRSGDVRDVSDDEINVLMKELGQKTDHVVAIFDSCHSGSATRVADSAVRSIPADLRPPPPEPAGAAATRGLGDDGTDFRERGANYVFISGSRPEELSNETVLGGQVDGALTYFLVNALRTGAKRATYRDVMLLVRDEVNARFPSQHPTIEGPGQANLVFGTERVKSRPSVLVEPRGTQVDIGGGITVGLAPGARLEVFAVDDADGANRLAEVEIVSATPFTSVGRVMSGAVTQRSRGEITHSSFGSFRASVWIQPGARAATLTALRAALAEETLVKEVDREDAALLRLVRASGAWELRSVDAVTLAKPIPVGSADEVKLLTQDISQWSRWLAVRELKNPGAELDVSLDLKRADATDYTSPPAELAHGAKLTMKITNHSPSPVYVVLLDIASSGGIGVLYPPRGTAGNQESVAPGRDIEITREVFVPEGFDAETDTLKLIAATQPLDASAYALDPARSRLVSTTPVDDWVTRQRPIRIVRPAARATGVALLFEQPVTSETVTRSLGTGARATCPADGPPTGDCVRVAPFSSDGTVVEVQTAVSRDGAPRAVSAANAYEDAYTLLDQSGAVRAEPFLDVPMPSGTEPARFGTRSGGDAPPDPLTNDDRWSLIFVRAPQAQQLVRAALNRPPGEEAKGVRIAHPDTGFTQHPETRPAVLAAAGHDYVDNDADATDPLIDQDFLDNPGHGTASGSVIVSPNGRQLAGPGEGVSGIAPGAELVPLRVNESVVFVFAGKRVAKAIDDAANDKLGAKVSVISLAMGGPPSYTLHNAVKSAKKRGVLLISAGGNNVETVVWPARYSEAIAVAALGVRCKPWPPSSQGSAIDISAPGENVWRALVEGPGKFNVKRGSGTTFATGTTAGVAALWVSRYSETAEFKALKASGGLTDAFRTILQKTSWRPNDANDPSQGACKDATWLPKLYGPGIVNAEAAIGAPPPSGGARDLAPERRLDQLPLFSTLYPEGTPYSKVEADYLALFGGPARTTVKQVGRYENEVLYHYTVDKDVADAIEAVVAGDGLTTAAANANALLRSRDISRPLRKALSQ